MLSDMGMMINRRRIAGKKEDTYIQDGLVFWLDGIDKGHDPLAWTDLINGIGFPYNSGQDIRSDSVYFNGREGLTSSSPSLNHPLESCQIEVVVDNNSGILITPNKNANIAFGFYLDNVIGATNPSMLKYQGVFPKQKTSYSMNINHLIYNAVVLNPAMYDYWAVYNLNVYEIGHKNNNYKYAGNIYSIRIYNRHLTNEERLHNLEVDNKEFNLGLSLNQ